MPRPVAFLLFTLVVDRHTNVADLTLDQVQQLYAGNITNWKQLGGSDLPVVMVSRFPGSGTRRTFQRQVIPSRLGPDLLRAATTSGEKVRCRAGRASE
ncbi:substrate-binding domain-containing protein [Actinokineospora diospyrosa]|uniref:substrate-binding domain-containing protein n=1 Tax=Actinokineospora diospyrosa TaxID=103728 RepID=UPI0020A507B7|nr:substrate-binding domain-containing protein [Actinokineospora diospyrosa]